MIVIRNLTNAPVLITVTCPTCGKANETKLMRYFNGSGLVCTHCQTRLANFYETEKIEAQGGTGTPIKIGATKP